MSKHHRRNYYWQVVSIMAVVGSLSNAATVRPPDHFYEVARNDIQDDPRYAPMDAKLNRVYAAVRSQKSGAAREALKQQELEFLYDRETLKRNPDAYFSFTEKRIAELQDEYKGEIGNDDHSTSRIIEADRRTYPSPDGKYRLTRGKDLILSGDDSIPVVLEKDLEEYHAKAITQVLWSPEGDKVLVTIPHDEGSSDVVVAWLKGSAWKKDFPPAAPEQFEPPHYFGKQDKSVRWISNDVFEMTSAIIYNSREVQEAIRYRVQVTPSGPQLAE
jgi:hypothetical protein